MEYRYGQSRKRYAWHLDRDTWGMVASVTFCPPVSTRWSLPLCPLMSVAHKEFCATLCSGRKNRIKILNLSSPVLVNNAIYYCGWDILWGGEEQAYFGLELKSYCITAPTCGLSYSNYSPCRVMESKEGINSGDKVTMQIVRLRNK